MNPFERWQGVRTPVLGMLHLPPLPGAPRYQGSLDAIVDFVLNDARMLQDAGVHGLILENFGDVPFFSGTVPPLTVASMTAVAVAVRREIDLPLGINVLRNDGCSALAVAVASGASFIRVNVLSGARWTDQGLIQGNAAQLLRARAALSGPPIHLFADVDVKHSVPVGAHNLELETRDLVERSLADAIIVSGEATGKPVSLEHLTRVRQWAAPCPVIVGSGVTLQNAASLVLAGADLLIVGSSIKQDGVAASPVDPQRARQLVEAVKNLD